MLSAADYAAKFAAALPYDAYVKTGTEEQQRRWKQVYDVVKLSDRQRELVTSFTRRMNVLIVSGIWCGDCVQQCPLLQAIGDVKPDIVQVRLVDRDQNRDLAEAWRVNAGDRVPVAIFLSEDHEFCGVYGDRTLSRYRSIARKRLGAACEIALAAPDADELAAALQDWLDEFERIQLMLRLSPRLREKYGD